MRARHHTLRCAITLALLLLPTLACKSVVDDAKMDDFFARLGSVTVTVFPAYVRHGAEDSEYDSEAADTLAAFLRDESFAQTTVAAGEVPLAGEWRHNQAAMWVASARSFAEYVAAHPVDTEFAFVSESLMGGDHAIGVHAYVVNTTGDVIWGCHLNSHDDGFARRNPRTSAECTQALMEFLREDWKPAR